jgi:hypothetical protein
MACRIESLRSFCIDRGPFGKTHLLQKGACNADRRILCRKMLQSPIDSDSRGSGPAWWTFLRWAPCVSGSAFRRFLDPWAMGVGVGTRAARSYALVFYSAHLGFQPSSDGSPGFCCLIHSMPASVRVSFQNYHSYEKIFYYSATDIGFLLGRKLSSHDLRGFGGKTR